MGKLMLYKECFDQRINIDMLTHEQLKKALVVCNHSEFKDTMFKKLLEEVLAQTTTESASSGKQVSPEEMTREDLISCVKTLMKELETLKSKQRPQHENASCEFNWDEATQRRYLS